MATAFLERARRVDAALNCFVELDGDGALDAAALRDDRAAADESLPSLHGVPFAWKDVLARPGRPAGAGAQGVRLRVRADSSTVLERLDRDGAVPLGALTLDPFAYAPTGLNSELGDTRNPWDPDRIAGGSSSGAAVAVAAGAAAFAIGSDTGGSVRVPAAFCGVTGLKPTQGLVPKRGALPLSYSQDTIGILACSALDVAAVLGSLAGHDPRDGGSLPLPQRGYEDVTPEGPRPLAGLRVGIDRPLLEKHADGAVVAAAEDASAVLAGLGAAVVDVDLALLDRCDAAATVLTWAEAAAVHGPTLARSPDAYPAPLRARLELALVAGGADHVDALRYRGRALRTFLGGPLAAADLLLAPTVPGPPPVLADASAAVVPLLHLNRPFSFLGLPALALPVGFDGLGLPLGAQLVGRPGDESTLLRCGAAYPAATDWHRRRPPLPTGDPAARPPT